MAHEIENDTFGDTNAEHVACSLAISAKRQADALEQIAAALWGEPGTTGLVQLVGFVAERARSGA